jgi:hypothetical protein
MLGESRMRDPNRLPEEGLPDDVFAGERFIRVVGRRKQPAIGEVPNREVRRAMDALHGRGVRAPKGVFRYSNHEEANRDWDEWIANAMAASDS